MVLRWQADGLHANILANAFEHVEDGGSRLPLGSKGILGPQRLEGTFCQGGCRCPKCQAGAEEWFAGQGDVHAVWQVEALHGWLHATGARTRLSFRTAGEDQVRAVIGQEAGGVEAATGADLVPALHGLEQMGAEFLTSREVRPGDVDDGRNSGVGQRFW